MIQLIQLKSSNLAAAGHDAATNTLAVHFTNGSVYHYKDVPADVANGLMENVSPGRYFAANIRGAFDGERVVDEASAEVE